MDETEPAADDEATKKDMDNNPPVVQPAQADPGGSEKEKANANGQPPNEDVQDLNANKVGEEKPDVTEDGTVGCKCLPMNKLVNNTEEHVIHIQGSRVTFPPDYGDTCKAWDDNLHPECKPNEARKNDAKTFVKPDYCTAKWCYIDPCKCDITKINNSAPLHTLYDGRKYKGKDLYWSHATCGSSSEEAYALKLYPDACNNQKREPECDDKVNCAWKKDQCLAAPFADPKAFCSNEEEKDGSLCHGASVFVLSMAVTAQVYFFSV
jgi:hypothetical protein